MSTTAAVTAAVTLAELVTDCAAVLCMHACVTVNIFAVVA
jgi:hypothetical protein